MWCGIKDTVNMVFDVYAKYFKLIHKVINLSWFHDYSKDIQLTENLTTNVLIFIYFIFFYTRRTRFIFCCIFLQQEKNRTEDESFDPVVTQGLTHLWWDLISFLPFYLFSLRRPHFFWSPSIVFLHLLYVFMNSKNKKQMKKNQSGSHARFDTFGMISLY